MILDNVSALGIDLLYLASVLLGDVALILSAILVGAAFLYSLTLASIFMIRNVS